ncbi:hypothetical protein GW17_00027435 [Ensete ventricosum]|nr:hypothetical protein GW17_00027435 [Ensete ventricosum]
MESGGGREAIRPVTAEEEAMKRNTDCVYFLASPLTCKKPLPLPSSLPLSLPPPLTHRTGASSTADRQVRRVLLIIQGSECEYRHSEGARINPRDCWYWLNGNCLNPKCSFRHPVREFYSSYLCSISVLE